MADLNHEVRLMYFPLKGRAELIRLTFHAGDIPFHEQTITFAEWPKKRNSMWDIWHS